MERAIKFKETLVEPGKLVQIELEMIDLPDNATGIPGFPETRVTRPSVSGAHFQPKRIDVDPECADSFLAGDMFIKYSKQWIAKEFSVSLFAKKPQIKFDVIDRYDSVVLFVRNTSPRTSLMFRASLVGDEFE